MRPPSILLGAPSGGPISISQGVAPEQQSQGGGAHFDNLQKQGSDLSRIPLLLPRVRAQVFGQGTHRFRIFAAHLTNRHGLAGPVGPEAAGLKNSNLDAEGTNLAEENFGKPLQSPFVVQSNNC